MFNVKYISWFHSFFFICKVLAFFSLSSFYRNVFFFVWFYFYFHTFYCFLLFFLLLLYRFFLFKLLYLMLQLTDSSCAYFNSIPHLYLVYVKSFSSYFLFVFHFSFVFIFCLHYYLLMAMVFQIQTWYSTQYRCFSFNTN